MIGRIRQNPIIRVIEFEEDPDRIEVSTTPVTPGSLEVQFQVRDVPTFVLPVRALLGGEASRRVTVFATWSDVLVRWLDSNDQWTPYMQVASGQSFTANWGLHAVECAPREPWQTRVIVLIM